jgi:putative flippase GtrA
MSFRKQFSFFFGIGFIATIADYCTMISLHEVADLNAVISSLGGYLIGGLVSYTLNRRHTFQTNRSHFDAGLRFITVMACCFVLTGIMMHALVDILAIPYILARIGTTGTIFFINFTVHKFWTFTTLSDTPSQ